MRLDINLATHVYEDSRHFWVRWGTGLGILAIVTLALLAITVSNWYDARIDRKKISDFKNQIAERDKERMTAEALLNQPDNRSMRERSQYLNELIARKAFSWTRAFEDLERVMPARIHLVSIQPHLNDDNQLDIKMTVAGDSQDRAIELVRRMEESQRFRETRIDQITTQQGMADPVQVGIDALYVPTQEAQVSTQDTHATPAPKRPVMPGAKKPKATMGKPTATAAKPTGAKP